MEMRRSLDRLISTMRFPILVRWHLYIEPPPPGSCLNIKAVFSGIRSFIIKMRPPYIYKSLLALFIMIIMEKDISLPKVMACNVIMEMLFMSPKSYL